MAGVSISSVLEKLEAETQTVRTRGLDELKLVLGAGQNATKIDALRDESFHAIFEALYRLVRVDKTAYLRAARSKSKNSAASRLSAAAAALRLVVEAGCSRIKFKTAVSVLDHITGTLSTPNGEFCEPLRNDYLKSFRTLLEYPPYGEHLRPKQWQAFVDFSISGILSSLEGVDPDNNLTSSRDTSLSSRGLNHLSIRTSQSGGRRSPQPGSTTSLDELLGAMRALTAITNAPIVSRGAIVLDTIIEFLVDSSRSQDVALEIINNVAFVLATEDIGIMRRSLESLIPILRRLWSSTKLASVKDQVLVTLTTCRNFFLAEPGSTSAVDPILKDGLLSTLMSDYSGRTRRDLLQVDDLNLIHPGSGSDTRRPNFTPPDDSPRAISTWTTLSAIASLVSGLSQSPEELGSKSAQTNVAPPTKRRKVQNPAEDLFDAALGSDGQERLVALQVLFFMYDSPLPFPADVEDSFPLLLNTFLEDNLQITAWTLLLFSRFASSPRASTSSLRMTWDQVWEAARRAITHSATTRSACVVLNSIIQAHPIDTTLSVALIQESLFPSGTNGPSSLTDAALLLFMNVLQSDWLERDDFFEAFSMKVIGWLGLSWTLPAVPDRYHNSQLAFHARPEYLCPLIFALKGAPLSFDVVHVQQNSHPILRAKYMTEDNARFSNYYTNLPDQTAVPRMCTSTDGVRVMDPKLLGRLDRVIFELLSGKIKAFQETWNTLAVGRSSNINSDIASLTVTACFVTKVCASSTSNLLSPPTAVLKQVDDLWRTVEQFLWELPTESFTAMVAVAASVVLRMTDARGKGQNFLAKCSSTFVDGLLRLTKRSLQPQDEQDDLDLDMMDSFETRTSQATQSKFGRRTQNINRCEVGDQHLANDSIASSFLSLLVQSEVAQAEIEIDARATGRLVGHIVQLDTEQLFDAQSAVLGFLNLEAPITRPEATRLLERLAETFLQDDHLERCEAALCYCLKVMKYLVPMWTVDEDDDLTSVALDMYSWYLNTGLDKGIASPKVLLHLAILLDSILLVNVTFGDGDLPSPRTSMLKILGVAGASLKYQLAPRLSHLFERYVLSEHIAIFNDIVENLPSDLDNAEGIAVRFYVISELGAKWHTVLRQATYNLTETAAHVPLLERLGTTCLRRMCDSLNIPTARHLFKYFSPQIFYTWLGSGSISQMPFTVFEYASLSALALENKIELVAQIALRGSTEHSEELADLLGLPWTTLLDQAFPRAEAYCLASETSLPQGERLFNGSESQVRKQLGTDLYVQALRDALPSTICTLLITLQDDQGVERSFEKAKCSEALSIYQRICARSKSNLILPPAQQPSFRAKFLLQELAYLCNRTETEFSQLWEPALLVYLYRSLLESAVPALGPLHACSVLRKIRIVVCLGGADALSGYPLEMLLQNLQPYLTNFHCAEDSIGLFWYLLENGRQYLQSRLSFLSGLSVSTFASLTDFIASSQDSTTQESHFLSTMSKAQGFRVWFGKFLAAIEPADVTPQKRDLFKHLMRCASSMTCPGSNTKSTVEGSVLLDLLNDRLSEQPLLMDSHFKQSLRYLCKDFIMSPDPQDDILASAEDAARFYPVLKETIQWSSFNDSYRIWAGQALGRGIATGCQVRNTPNFQSHRYSTLSSSSSSTTLDLTEASSYLGIVKSLCDSLWKGDAVVATSAERALQLIAGSVNNSDSTTIFGTEFDRQLFDDLRFIRVPPPTFEDHGIQAQTLASLEYSEHSKSSSQWASDMVTALCSQLSTDPVLTVLPYYVTHAPEAAATILPFTVHLVLSAELSDNQRSRNSVSKIFAQALSQSTTSGNQTSDLVLETVLYLRRCRLPMQTTMAQRNNWIDIDFEQAAAAAKKSKTWHAALLFAEIQHSQISLATSRSSRNSASTDASSLSLLTAEIFQNVNDPDFFYAAHEDTDLHSVIQRLSHESAGYKNLSFQSALFDSAIRSDGQRSEIDRVAFATAEALKSANLEGISGAVSSFTAQQSQAGSGRRHLDLSTNSHEWKVSPRQIGEADNAGMLHTLQSLASASNRDVMTASLGVATLKLVNAFSVAANQLQYRDQNSVALAVLAEARHILSFSTQEEFETFFEDIAVNDQWTRNQPFETISTYVQARENVFGLIRRNEQLRTTLGLTFSHALLLEARTLRQSLRLVRHHDVPQFCLNRATYLSELSNLANSAGIKIDVSSQYDLATTFWAQSEISASIKVLQNISKYTDIAGQAIHVSRSEILTDLGQKIAEARLEKPDEIIANYLLPSIKELNGEITGTLAGRVFHNFANFCDMQLQDVDNHDDFTRISKIRERKLLEVHDLEKMISGTEGKQREQLKIHVSKAKTWFKLDDEEWQRLQANRETLIIRCLENYLLSMRACDDFSNDTLRLLSLWLDQSDSKKANAMVHKHLASVPTRKFAPLMNQLTSRILDNKDSFQQLLMDLMFRICSDHPHHSLYQVFSTSKSKGAKNDEMASSRYAAANKLAELVRQKGASGNVWISVHNSSIAFVRVAQEKISDKELKTGSKLLLRKLRDGSKLISTIEGSSTKIPPPTMKIELRVDRDYSSVPVMVEFEPQISIAGGVSAPKIATTTASDGSRHKMLLKGGNDDLRQDSIMEQVFEQVSNLLRDHRAARQRRLGIRTYKVVPLYPNAGIIEFVQNTVPLHDYLLPAHTRYFPKDYKPNRCRKEISEAQTKPLQQRMQAYRNVTTNFHPVMRFFFMDHFLDPDEWFHKRLNYSRSTAAISILGHVLGLGDRHGHNILLDENSGEVVHIDLGVAFEAGRVLPVPEVVPFRLTRDLVDGMGISGVEGVFRRCCNFTLDALRHEQEAIMTILDVLRYGPLYSWSVSPLRLQKMQENNQQAATAAAAAANETSTASTTGAPANADAAAGAGLIGIGGGAATTKHNVGEPNEADRALTVVAKKLGKSLSVEATVNELIRQATDERNLAVLYCGWAAYA